MLRLTSPHHVNPDSTSSSFLDFNASNFPMPGVFEAVEVVVRGADTDCLCFGTLPDFSGLPFPHLENWDNELS